MELVHFKGRIPMDPITTIVTALVLGAAAGLKPVAEEAVKDAYTGLKTIIRDKYNKAISSVDDLEEKPESQARREVVKEKLADIGADQDENLVDAAQEMIKVVEEHEPASAGRMKIDLKRVKAGSWTMKDLIAAGELTIEADTVDVDELDISGLRSGAGADDHPNS